MFDGEPVLLIASVSAYEAELLELSLRPAGWDLVRVHGADEAARLLARCRERAPVLVIDSGVLEMPHDGQWRELRALFPELGTIVRCLLPQRGIREPRDGRTLEVHPDDVDGIRAAVRGLCPSSPASAHAPPLWGSAS